tara:strand:- start:171 stop:614 length:444 start_codon:yes stop_codon:yes gene_type:complete
MASLLFYVGGSAAAYWVGTNLLYRSANSVIDYVLNTKASSDIEGTHTVKSIHAMLSTYKDLPETHPAYGAMMEVRDGLQDLQTSIERAKLRYEAHKGGYISRFRTFDASVDNAIIDKKVKQLMVRIELFTELMKLPANHPSNPRNVS